MLQKEVYLLGLTALDTLIPYVYQTLYESLLSYLVLERAADHSLGILQRVSTITIT